jgi:hypothetical protein
LSPAPIPSAFSQFCKEYQQKLQKEKMGISEPYRNKYANMLPPPLNTQISEGDSDQEENHTGWWKCSTCGGYWRTTGRVGWEESEQEKENNVETSREAEICEDCEGHLW